MMYIITDSSVVITVNNHQETFSKRKFSKELLNSKLLAELSFQNLLEIWENLYGIPKSIKDILIKKIELYSCF